MHSHHDCRHSHPDFWHFHHYPHSHLHSPHSHPDSCIPTMLPRISISPIIPFRDSPFRLLQVCYKKEIFRNYLLEINNFLVQVLSCEFWDFSKNTFFTEHLSDCFWNVLKLSETLLEQMELIVKILEGLEKSENFNSCGWSGSGGVAFKLLFSFVF